MHKLRQSFNNLKEFYRDYHYYIELSIVYLASILALILASVFIGG